MGIVQAHTVRSLVPPHALLPYQRRDVVLRAARMVGVQRAIAVWTTCWTVESRRIAESQIEFWRMLV